MWEVKNKNYHYIYIQVGDKYITYSPGHITKEGYYLTDELDKAFYFASWLSDKAFKNICKKAGANPEEAKLIHDKHIGIGTNDIRSIIYERYGWNEEK